MEKNQDISSGKMYLEPSLQTKERTLEESLMKLYPSKDRIPQCLCLIKTSGHTPTYLWEKDSALLTDFLTQNTSECPSEGEESFLSQILMEEVHPKYYLSQRACEGILRRAKKRGKELPEILQKVLEKQAISA